MRQVLFLRGLPASGKTTFAKAWVAEDPLRRVRINKDDIRAEFNWSKKVEKEEVIPTRDNRLRKALLAGNSVVIDDTNLERIHYSAIKDIVQEFDNTEMVIHDEFLKVPLEVCLERNARREHPVPEKWILKSHKRLAYRPVITPYPVDPKLPWAIICDLDGTASLFCINYPCSCDNNHRSPYDASTSHKDTLNPAVAFVLNSLGPVSYCEPTDDNYSTHLFMVSGREERYRGQTLEFLRDNDIAFDALYMRPSLDNRDDTIIKREIFEREIKGKYNIRFVLDDRNRVVDFWRSLGITCFQVAEGNF